MWKAVDFCAIDDIKVGCFYEKNGETGSTSMKYLAVQMRYLQIASVDLPLVQQVEQWQYIDTIRH